MRRNPQTVVVRWSMPTNGCVRRRGTDLEKRCSRCRKWLPAQPSHYNRLWRGPAGLQSACRKCQRALNKSHYETPAGKAAVTRYRKAHWDEYLDYQRRWRDQPNVKERRAAKAYAYNRTSERRACQAAWQKAKRDRLRAARR